MSHPDSLNESTDIVHDRSPAILQRAHSVNSQNRVLIDNNIESSDADTAEYFQHTSNWLGTRQFFALVHKNWIIKKRNPCQSICEILAPILFTLLLYVGYKVALSSLTVNPATIYVNQTFPIQPILQDTLNIAQHR